MDDRVGRAGRFMRETASDALRQVQSDHDQGQHLNGFRAAAGITLRHVDAKLDALKDQMRGVGLTKAEQMAYAQFDELRSEIEAACDVYWRGTSADWRPRKPVAKAVVRSTEES